MKVSGHGFREHVQMLTPLLVLIASVWALRFLVDLLSAPQWLITLVSISATVSISVLLAVLLIHVRRFGGYASVVLSTVILVTWGQLLIVLAILLSLWGGVETVYTQPEFSMGGQDPYHLRHIVGHLTFGIGWGILVGSAMGCFLFYFLRRFVPDEPRPDQKSRV